MVVPVATSQQLARSFRTTLLGAMGLGIVASLGGLVISAFASFKATVAPGPTIVLLALACFAVTWPIGALLRHRRRLAAPFPVDPEALSVHETCEDDHEHRHGRDCGHLAVEHGDHVDYVHDGHRHAVHVDQTGAPHYDEH
jgi:zinc transport system permease protein